MMKNFLYGWLDLMITTRPRCLRHLIGVVLLSYALLPDCFAHVFLQTHYQVCFTPQQNCTRLITKAIATAKQSIHVQLYSFTSWRIAHAFVRAKKRGIHISILADKTNLNLKYGKTLHYLMRHQIPVWIDNQVRIAHNKVIIIDHQTVITGSFNFTYAAQHKNAENLLIIHDKPLATTYLKNWSRRKKQSYRLDRYPTKQYKPS